MGRGIYWEFQTSFGIHCVTLLYLMGLFFPLSYLFFSFLFLRRLSNCIAFDLGFGSFGDVCGLILKAVGDGAFWLEIRFLACSVCTCLAWVEVSLGGRIKGTTDFHLLLLRVFSFLYPSVSFSLNVILHNIYQFFSYFS